MKRCGLHVHHLHKSNFGAPPIFNLVGLSGTLPNKSYRIESVELRRKPGCLFGGNDAVKVRWRGKVESTSE